ncbi:MAG TPA: nitric oxide-sensing protein NosP [Candidatus Sulfotelmatobacter sp.]|jgi:hypothetical protein|nr:nitric oxide-sensing protein NosP [Candidatus Sulfotelmatobacter sp.]
MPLSQSLDQKIRRGATTATDPAQVASELARDLRQDDLSLVLLFITPERATPELVEAVHREFGQTLVVGCTTAGEITPEGYTHGTVTGVSFAAPDFHVAARRIPDTRLFSVADGPALVQGCLRELEIKAPDWPQGQVFAMLLIDGLDACEENVVSALHRELGPIPLFGGSAGDELSFRQTNILWDGGLHRHSAILMLVATNHPFRVFKTEHFASGSEKMVVTEADPARRIVREINAEPAAEEYARMVGLEAEPLTPMVFANHPVVVRVGNVPYVRSIQKVNPDNSLTFFCAIDEGIVLTVAKALDISEDLGRLFDDLRQNIRQPEVIIGCDCLFRGLEMRKKGLEKTVSDLMVANNVVGFHTYGEQFHAMHVNQTFTGVAIGRREE